VIFDRHIAWHILDGKVTQFRRPVRSPRPGWTEGELHKLEVERRGADGPERHILGFIRIAQVELQALADITDEDARASGWRDARRLFTRWREKYGTGPLDPDARCWTVTFELSREHIPRLLHRDSQHGYTHDPRLALVDEPEAVDETTQADITRRAGEVYNATHAEDELRRKARSLSAQLKETVNRATRKGIDIDENVERIRAELDAVQRKLREAA
jgi:hypothetical protein